MKELFHKAILSRPLVSDGAMGTQLMLAGLEPGGCGEAWNLMFPDPYCSEIGRYCPFS